MRSSSGFQQSLRRLKPEKRRKGLAYRDRTQLRFLPSLKPPFPKLLLDTTVYIDALQGRLGADTEIVLRAASLWHSTVTEAELAALAGLLHPAHPGTASVIAQVAASIDLRPAHRILTPDRETWRDAGILAGLLARLQRYGKNERRKALPNALQAALIFLTASRNGCVVLTRNVLDFDLIMQLDPKGQAVFYDPLGSVAGQGRLGPSGLDFQTQD